jgi:hypothetical protein
MATPGGSRSSSSNPEQPQQRPEQRWRTGVNTENADNAELSEYVEWRIQVYTRERWRNEDLSEYYAEDFKGFTRETFDNCPADLTRRLRDCLRDKGVFVRKGRGVQVAAELAKVVQDDIPWPVNDPDRPEPVLRATSQTPSSTAGTAAMRAAAPMQPVNAAESQSALLVPRLGAREQSVSTEQATNQTHNHGRELANLAKLYGSEDMKYGGEPFDSFSYKYTIFIDHCDRADVPEAALTKAFPTMLKGLALDYYYSSCRGQYATISDLCRAMQAYFENDDSQRTIQSLLILLSSFSKYSCMARQRYVILAYLPLQRE